MKKTLLTLLLAIATMMSLQARTFVLVTGISNYNDDKNNLRQTTKDAKSFKELMETQTKDITILTSSYVTRANVLEKLKGICNRAQAGDRIVFFYSGHGTPGAMCGYDSYITYDDLINTLSTSAASEKICFIDACHAGSMAASADSGDWTRNVKGKKDMALFVACRANEFSKEDGLLGAGYFTQALLKGLRGKSDTNGNKEITVMELFRYIYGDVLKRTNERQHPQLIAPESMHNVVVAKWE